MTGLATRLSGLPAAKRRAALEVSAALAGVSLRVSRDFVEAAPEAAEILSADEIRAWGELGRRIAMGKADSGSKFFEAGVTHLSDLPKKAREYLFKICTRQLVLSSSISFETFQFAPQLAADIADDELLTEVLRLGVEIANRSAKHSSEFLMKTSPVAATFAVRRRKASHGRDVSRAGRPIRKSDRRDDGGSLDKPSICS